MKRTADSLPTNEAELRTLLTDPLWRLNNLYWIIDKRGERVKFKMNWAQLKLYRNLWYWNLILKARQLGITTEIMLIMLDQALFNGNFSAGVIAHEKEEAVKLFRQKIRFPYDNLDPIIKNEIRPVGVDSKSEMVFNNNSSIRVATSMRSGTLNFLHISEFGKICKKYPDKAKEIVTGSMESLGPKQMLCIESTAEGRDGYFYRFCKDAMDMKLSGTRLTPMDFRIFFFPWWKHPEYQLNDRGVLIIDEHEEYFQSLFDQNEIRLTIHQKRWYVKKLKTQGEDMRKEYPSTWEEAFAASLEGAYYSKQFTKVREEGRITSVPYNDSFKVDTWWDLGMNDSMCIWFTQDVGREIRVIDYLESSDEGLAYYARELDKKPYHYGRHTAPFDIRVREIGTGTTRHQKAAELGIRFEVCPKGDLQDGIEAVRNILSQCVFDAEKCAGGIHALEEYRKEWDDKLGCFKNKPLHNWASHPSDAFRTLAGAHDFTGLFASGRREVIVDHQTMKAFH